MQLTPLQTAVWQGDVEGANATTGELSGASLFKFNGIYSPGFSVELSSPSDLSALEINPVLVDYISYPVGLSVFNFEDVYFFNACKVATTTNITLSGSQTIDGVEVGAGERILVKDQSAQSQNGVYLASAGLWARDGTLINGSFIKAAEGTYGANRIAKTVLGLGFVLDTSSVIFTGFENNVKVIQRDTVYYLRFKNFGTTYRTYATVAIYGMFQAATTANILLSGSQTIDGVTVVNGSYVLVKNQTILSENGPYVVQPGTTPWGKLTTYESENLFYYTLAGTANGGKHFVQTAGGSNEFIHASVVLYETVADATDEVNPIIPFLPVAGIGLRLYWFYKNYNIPECIEFGEADIEDIICCPPSVGNLPPTTATITQQDSSVTVATVYQGFPYVNSMEFRHYGYVNAYQQPNVFYRHEVLVENIAIDFTGQGFISYTPPIEFGRNVSAPFDLQDAPLTVTCISIYAEGHAYYWPPVTVVFSGTMVIPDIRLTMTNAKFIKQGDDIAIGNIDVTLTYDSDSGYWFGPLENYYNIPGRLHMKLELVKPGETFVKNYTNLSPMIRLASGLNLDGYSLTYWNTPRLFYYLGENVIIGDSNAGTAYAGSAFAGNYYHTNFRFAIKYSTYNSAKKPENYLYQYAFFRDNYGSFYSTDYQTSDFFNSNNYWLSSGDATLTAIAPP
jgi:hypothetical protein